MSLEVECQAAVSRTWDVLNTQLREWIFEFASSKSYAEDLEKYSGDAVEVLMMTAATVITVWSDRTKGALGKSKLEVQPRPDAYVINEFASVS